MSRRWRFFGGKGGAGKTTCAAATALVLAEEGRKVLCISTDPAHSLGDAFARKLSHSPRRVPTRRGELRAVELDARRAFERWIRPRRGDLRTIVGRGTYLDEEDVERFLDLSLPGLDEMVALLWVSRLAGEGNCPEVVVDTAPTGHTLRLLDSPGMLRRIAAILDGMLEKHRVIARSLGAAGRPDGADLLLEEIDAEGARLRDRLRDRRLSSFTWLLNPEELSVAEAQDALTLLDAQGIAVEEVIANRVTPPPPGRCSFCESRRRAESLVLRSLSKRLGPRPLRILPALDREPVGLASLRKVGSALRAPPGRLLFPSPAERLSPAERKAGPGRAGAPARPRSRPAAFSFEVPREVRLLFFGGKGGVGKTTCAAAAALALSRREPRRSVLLLSTDPAHSLSDVLEAPVGPVERRVAGAPPFFRACELDAPRLFAEKRESYRRAVEEIFDSFRQGIGLDSSLDRRVMEDLIDLAPPGIDEILAVLAVLAELESRRLVVVDTAPTGHALRLLEMPGKAQGWVKALLAVLLKYRGVVRLGKAAAELVELSKGLARLRAALRDRSRTRFVAVTRAGGLPLAETGRLLGALGRMALPLQTVVVNALTPPGCARCLRAARHEARWIEEARALARKARAVDCAIITAPAAVPAPQGVKGLLAWGRTWSRV